MKRLISLFTIMFVLSSAAVVQAELKTGVEVERLAVDFTLNSIHPKKENSQITHTLSEYRGKSRILLTFWATWCPSCVHEVNDLKAIEKKHSGDDLKVLAVNVGSRETEKKIKSFIEKKGINYTVLYDKDGAVSRQYQIRGIPTVLLIDKEGIIRYKGHHIPQDLEMAMKPRFFSKNKQKEKPKGFWDMLFGK